MHNYEKVLKLKFANIKKIKRLRKYFLIKKVNNNKITTIFNLKQKKYSYHFSNNRKMRIQKTKH